MKWKKSICALLAVKYTETSGHYFFIFIHKGINIHFVIFPPFCHLLPPPSSSSSSSLSFSQWSQRCTCPQAPQLCWMAAMSHWWPPALQSAAVPLLRSSGRPSCTGDLRSRVRMRKIAPPPPYVCATCGSHRGPPRGRYSPAWWGTRPCRQSFVFPTR